MLKLLRQQLTDHPLPVGHWELVQTGAEELPFADDSFDTVTGGYVHCTIPDPAAALAEIARVLEPGGHYLLIEHVRAARSVLGRVQDLIEPVHVYVAAGCHPDRRTEQVLRNSARSVEHLEHARLPRSSPSVRPLILG